MPTSERSLPGFKAFFTRSLNAAQKGLASNADKDTLIQLTKSLHDSYLKYESCVNDIMKDDSIESTVLKYQKIVLDQSVLLVRAIVVIRL